MSRDFQDWNAAPYDATRSTDRFLSAAMDFRDRLAEDERNRWRRSKRRRNAIIVVLWILGVSAAVWVVLKVL